MQRISFIDVKIQELVWTIKPTSFVNNYDLKSFLILLQTYYVFAKLYNAKKKKKCLLSYYIFSPLQSNYLSWDHIFSWTLCFKVLWLNKSSSLRFEQNISDCTFTLQNPIFSWVNSIFLPGEDIIYLENKIKA